MKKFLVIIVVPLFILIGCGGKEEIKLSPDSMLATESVNSINTIKKAYEEKDKDVLMTRLDPAIAEGVLQELSFEKAELSFTTRLVRIKDSTVMVNLNWHGTWVIKGKNLTNRGVSIFVFEGSPLKLIRIEGDNPFLILSRVAENTEDVTNIPSQEVFEDVQTVYPQAEDTQTVRTAETEEPAEQKPASPQYEDISHVNQSPLEIDINRDKGYYIQVGAWKNLQYAQQMLEKLKIYYPETYLFIINNYHKVWITGIETEQQGAILLRELEEKFNIKAFLKKNNSIQFIV